MIGSPEDTAPERGSVLCFGELLVDRFPEGPVPGGAPANVAYHLHRFGFDAVPVTRVGDDAEGELLLRHLESVGLPVTFTSIDPDHPTGGVDIELDESGEPHYRIAENVAWDHITADEHLLDAASRARGIVFGTLALRGEQNRRTLERILDSTSGFVTLDVNFRPPFDLPDTVQRYADRVDLLKMNEGEARRLAGEEPGPLPRENQIARQRRMERIRTEFGGECICVTRGAEGADLLAGERFYSEPGQPVEVIDTVGAGDAFLAALLASLLEGRDSPGTALHLACRHGELVAGRKGATPEY